VKKIFGYKTDNISNQTIEILQEAIDDKRITIKHLFKKTNNSINLRNIYASIAQKHLCLNWEKEFSQNSIVHLPSKINEGLKYEEISNSGRYGSILQELVLGSGEDAERILAITKSEEQQIKNYNPLGFF